MGRPQKYDWEDKRDICYQLHVEQKLSGAQIVKYFANHFGVNPNDLPGVNQFYARFRLWGFPSRRVRFSAEEKKRLVTRTRELFNQNLPAQDTLKTLQNEGWDIDRYQFRILRKKHGMVLRSARGFRKLHPESDATKGNVDHEVDEEDHEEGLETPKADHHESISADGPTGTSFLPPEEAARRAQRLIDLQIQSDQLLHTRKRRRRIRGYGHLPPDAPGTQPRYGSETSLDECKAYLHLTNELYVAIRQQYTDICHDMGIVKMTLCQDGEWQASKDRLVRESEHLSAIMHPLEPDLERKWVALNCICTDVTKRIRSQARFISIADANNILNLDPTESKEVRRILYEILAADQFTSVIASGKDHVNELREQWYAKVPVLQEAIGGNEPLKKKAVDVLAKDVRKRFCDDRSRSDPARKDWQKLHPYGPGPGPAPGISKPSSRRPRFIEHVKSNAAGETPDAATSSQVWTNSATSDLHNLRDGIPTVNFNLDPLLTSAIRGPPWPPSDTAGDKQGPPRKEAAATAVAHGLVERQRNTSEPVLNVTTAYFRLDPLSSLHHEHPKLWLGRLTVPTMTAVRAAACAKASQNDAAVRASRIQGIVKNAEGGEDAWVIETDDELQAYLDEAHGKATFVVVLEKDLT